MSSASDASISRRPTPAMRSLAALALLAAGSGAAVPALAAAHDVSSARTGDPLAVCAEPDNLPFSSSQEPRHGIYIEMARRLGEKLGRPVKMVWVPGDQGNRGVRASLGAGLCDLQIGLPGGVDFMAPRIVTTKPFGQAGYALVVGATSSVRDPAGLAGMRVAVEHGSPPQNVLAQRDDVRPVTVRTPEAALQSMRDGEADAAWIWGPSAGYLSRQMQGTPYRVVPTAGPGMQWSLAIGMRRQDTALRESVEAVLDDLIGAVPAIARDYGVTLVADAGTSASDAAPAAAPANAAPASPAAGATGGTPDSPAAASTASAAAGDAEAGRTLFNTNCSHCHGPNAESPVQQTDLRRLRRKYRDDYDQVFQTTVEKGRPDKGMPTWGGVLPPASIANIKAFIDTVQVKKGGN